MSSEKETSISSGNNVKWIVIGVVSIVVLFLFKDEIGGLIERTESVSVSSEGLTLTTRTVDTVLGETIVSGPPTLETAGITAETQPNFKLDNGFMINWKEELWSKNDELAQLNNAELFLQFSIPEGFQPSIKIDSHQGFDSVESFLARISYPDRTDVKVELSPSGDSGVRTSTGEFNGVKFYFVERVIYNPSSGRVYVATAERPATEAGNEELWNSTRKVLNSFRLG